MKGYIDFADGFLGMEAIATKPIGKIKSLDWEKAKKLVEEHPNSVIQAGLLEDWSNTSGLIAADGKYCADSYVFVASKWATPIVDIDGEEIECWEYAKKTNDCSKRPKWWGKGKEIISEYDAYELIN